MNREKLFLDTEFTGLHQGTTLISLGIVAESGPTFYAECTDYAADQLSDWHREHVIDKLRFRHEPADYLHIEEGQHWQVKGSREQVREQVDAFLHRLGPVEIWSDCLAYDWVLFCELWGGSMGLPADVFYMPFDLATLLWARGEDPDVSRETFVQSELGELVGAQKHNALWDAQVMRLMYQKLQS